MQRFLLTITALLALFATAAWAEEDTHTQDRQVLLSMLGDIEKAINNRDMSAALNHLSDQVIITYQDATVTQGKAQAQAYFDRMMKGADAIVKEFHSKATVGAPAVFSADTAVAYGTTDDTFVLAKGLEFTLHGNWSTTMQKQNGEWKVLSIHFSSNLFDNPLINNAKRMNWIMGGGGILLGALLMWLLGRLRGRPTSH